MNKLKFLTSLFITVLFCSLLYVPKIYADIPSALSIADPVIQVQSYEIKNDNIELDSKFTIKITLKNSNAYATAYNIVAEVNTPDISMHLVDGEVNQKYFQSLGPNQTVSFEQSFYIEKSYPHRSAMLTYSFKYSSESGKTYSNSTSLTPKITIPCKLQLSDFSMSEKVSLGSRSHIVVKLVNDGTIDISNIEMRLNANIIDSQKSITLGGLKSGEELTQDCYFNFLKEGEQEVRVSFVYKDESGNTYTIAETSYPIEVTSENQISVKSDSDSQKGTITIAGNNISIVAFIFVMLIAAGIIYVIIQLYKSMQKGRRF
ncbi:MAG: hypothetical protein IJA34_03730 [Lachnospiraceae bacterium]|nr:hypothetical protein [Lachnospiraceae bacterium]